MRSDGHSETTPMAAAKARIWMLARTSGRMPTHSDSSAKAASALTRSRLIASENAAGGK